MLNEEARSAAESRLLSELYEQLAAAWEQFREAFRVALEAVIEAFIEAFRPVSILMRRVQLANSLTPYAGERVAYWLAMHCPERWLPEARWWEGVS